MYIQKKKKKKKKKHLREFPFKDKKCLSEFPWQFWFRVDRRVAQGKFLIEVKYLGVKRRIVGCTLNLDAGWEILIEPVRISWCCSPLWDRWICIAASLPSHWNNTIYSLLVAAQTYLLTKANQQRPHIWRSWWCSNKSYKMDWPKDSNNRLIIKKNSGPNWASSSN